MDDWKDILHDNEELNEQELMKYLEGNYSEEERFAVEKQMAGSAFINDAVEGLQQFNQPAKLQTLKDQLNRQLRKETSKKHGKKRKRGIKDQQLLILAVFAILFICILGYLLIHFYSGN